MHEEVVKDKGLWTGAASVRGMTEHPPRPGEDRDEPLNDAAHEHEERAESDSVAYQRHGHEEFEEAVDEAMHAEHAFDEAVAEAEHEAEHPTDG